MATMRAMVVTKPGKGLEMQERPMPQPGPREVRLRVHACGVCHSDTFIVDGLLPGLTYPRVPGHEVIATIDALGPDVQGWSVGERVGVGWSPGACGYCRNCRRGNAFACLNVQGATGITRDGGYATHMLALASALAHVPKALDGVQSAPLLCAGVTTFNALRHAGAAPGDLVAVHGVGGLGHLAVQYAARSGFRTVAINRGSDKEELSRSLGALHYIDSDRQDPAAALQELGGAKAILSTLTNAEAQQKVVPGLGVNGTMMVIGVGGALAVDPLALIGKCAAVRGWYSGTAADSEDALSFSEQQRVVSKNEIYPFAEAQAAYDRMKSGKAVFRAVLKID